MINTGTTPGPVISSWKELHIPVIDMDRRNSINSMTKENLLIQSKSNFIKNINLLAGSLTLRVLSLISCNLWTIMIVMTAVYEKSKGVKWKIRNKNLVVKEGC